MIRYPEYIYSMTKKGYMSVYTLELDAYTHSVYEKYKNNLE
jgi:hypothetical protein